MAHKELDDDVLGTAKTGEIKEVVVLEGHELIVATYDDGTEVAFDRREVVDLGPANNTNTTPVLLKPRHYLALFKRPLPVLMVLIAICLTGLMAIDISVNGIGPFNLIAYMFLLALFAYYISRSTKSRKMIAAEQETQRGQ